MTRSWTKSKFVDPNSTSSLMGRGGIQSYDREFMGLYHARSNWEISPDWACEYGTEQNDMKEFR